MNLSLVSIAAIVKMILPGGKMQSVRLGSVFLVSIVCLPAQTLSPREIFYGEGRAAAAPKPASKPKVAAANKPATPSTPAPQDTPEEVAAVPTIGAPAPTQDNVVRLVSVKTGPLGLKYSVLKRGPDAQYAEVDPDANFTANDSIRVSVEVNDPGYLYVVAQGSSGKWTVMFPRPETDGGDNRVRPDHQYNIPRTSFLFDSRAGTEKLFVVLSRQPEQDLESLIYSLRDKSPNDASPKTGQLSRTMMASNEAPIQDDLVQRMRQTYSRDLVIEKVDDAATPPPDAIRKIEVKHGAMIPPGEKAVYVVNQNAGENARVVASIELRHQ
jgi:hypothetical protein